MVRVRLEAAPAAHIGRGDGVGFGMHLHILGICGTFMGGLAAIAKSAGHRVTGCDANVYPPMSTQLRALGIELTEGWDAAQLRGIARDADVFVIGNVVSRGNPLMEAILERRPPVMFPDRSGCTKTSSPTAGCSRWRARTARRRRRRCWRRSSSTRGWRPGS